jgi:hypothetical protein
LRKRPERAEIYPLPIRRPVWGERPGRQFPLISGGDVLRSSAMVRFNELPI